MSGNTALSVSSSHSSLTRFRLSFNLTYLGSLILLESALAHTIGLFNGWFKLLLKCTDALMADGTSTGTGTGVEGMVATVAYNANYTGINYFVIYLLSNGCNHKLTHNDS